MVGLAGSAALFLSLGAVVIEGAALGQLGPGGLFGWVDLKYLGGVSWLALFPGVIGHTCLNGLLRQVVMLNTRAMNWTCSMVLSPCSRPQPLGRAAADGSMLCCDGHAQPLSHMSSIAC